MSDLPVPSQPQSNLPALWNPNKFEGTDLLPVFGAPQAIEEELVGRENVSKEDMVLPSLKLLQGMSPAVTEGQNPDARPGLIIHTGTQRIFKPPIRVLFVHHSRSNSLIPDPVKDPRTNGLVKCIARDGYQGDKYGVCEECRKCLDWGPNNEPPIGSQSHNFVALTEDGPAVVRFSRTSYKAAKQFLTTWTMGTKNLWAHPVVIRVKSAQKVLANGQKSTFFYWEPLWENSELPPPEVKGKAKESYLKVHAAYEDRRLKSHDDDTPDDQQ